MVFLQLTQPNVQNCTTVSLWSARISSSDVASVLSQPASILGRAAVKSISATVVANKARGQARTGPERSRRASTESRFPHPAGPRNSGISVNTACAWAILPVEKSTLNAASQATVVSGETQLVRQPIRSSPRPTASTSSRTVITLDVGHVSSSRIGPGGGRKSTSPKSATRSRLGRAMSSP